MAKGGQIAACGEVNNYNRSASKQDGLKNWFEVINMRLQIRGFIVSDFLSEVLDIFMKAIEESWTLAHRTSRLYKRNLWMKLYEGANTGKLATALQH